MAPARRAEGPRFPSPDFEQAGAKPHNGHSCNRPPACSVYCGLCGPELRRRQARSAWANFRRHGW